MDYKKITSTIPIMSGDEYIATEDASVTDDHMLRKIGYVVQVLQNWNIPRVRYVTYRFRSLLDLRRTESKNDGLGLILYHDKDIDTLRNILTMKDAGADDRDVIASLAVEKAVESSFNSSVDPSDTSLMAASDGNKLLNMLQEYISSSLLPELQSNHALIEDLRDQNNAILEQNEHLMNELEMQKKSQEQMQKEIETLHEELRRNNEANQESIAHIEENINKKRKKFLGIF